MVFINKKSNKREKSSKLNPGFKQFLIKTILFIALFIAFSFVIGQKIVSSSLLMEFYIYIYGRFGYILLFSIACFAILYREKLLKLGKFKHSVLDFLFIILSFSLLATFYLLELHIDKMSITITNIILVHTLFLSIFLFLLLGVYGLKFIRTFINHFKKEILYFVVFGLVAGSLMSLVWKSWPYFSLIVLKIVNFLLGLIDKNVEIVSSDVLIFKGFAAKIGEACSGVYSIFLFTALYLFIVFLDWKRINKKKAFLVFIPAVLGAFFVNVLRVFLIFIVGAYISEDIALGLYHSYTGMVLFLIYFTLFWVLFYKWMKNEKTSLIPEDTLYKNSLYLMVSTFIMSVLGFVFWMIVTRLFSTEDIGLATTIISLMSLVTTFSLLGLNTGLIRYLAKSKRKNDKINTCFTLVMIITVIITTIILLLLGIISSKLLFIKENMILSFVFIIFMVFASFNGLIDSIFLAYRNAKYILLKNSVFSIAKIGLPFFLVGLGAYGIFSSWMISLILGFLSVLSVLIYKYNYKPKFVFYDSIIKKIGKYSFGNYIAGAIGMLPTMLLPLIITNSLHPEITAYYYMAMMIANVLFIIPNATSNSLFAEGSYNEKNLKQQIKKSAKLISLFMIPAIILTIVLGKYIMLLFWQDY